MLQVITDRRADFLSKVAAQYKPWTGTLVIVTHILPDRPEFLRALRQLAPISAIFAVPYSVDESAFKELGKEYRLVRPSLRQMEDGSWLAHETEGMCQPGQQVMVLDIGGYFAAASQHMSKGVVAGIIEDTEAGHRRYERRPERPRYPIISVARSPLKDPENALIGTSCVFSVERVLRSCGFIMEAKRALVIGYGKIGRGVAKALHAKLCHVSVCDNDPIKRALALAEGYCVPDLDDALSSSDIVFGATGNTSVSGDRIGRLKEGAILASCSSRDIEFDLKGIKEGYPDEREVVPGLVRRRGARTVYVMSNGTPVNFLDGAVVGPALSLIQGEIISAIGQIAHDSNPSGLCEVSPSNRSLVARLWFDAFVDPAAGFYRQV